MPIAKITPGPTLFYIYGAEHVSPWIFNRGEIERTRPCVSTVRATPRPLIGRFTSTEFLYQLVEESFWGFKIKTRTVELEMHKLTYMYMCAWSKDPATNNVHKQSCLCDQIRSNESRYTLCILIKTPQTYSMGTAQQPGRAFLRLGNRMQWIYI